LALSFFFAGFCAGRRRSSSLEDSAEEDADARSGMLSALEDDGSRRSAGIRSASASSPAAAPLRAGWRPRGGMGSGLV